MSDSCSRCGGTGRFIGRNGRDQGPCWRCTGELAQGAPALVYTVRHSYGGRALPALGALVAAVAFMAVAGHMMKATPAAPAAPAAIDYGMLANAVRAAMPGTLNATPVVAPVKAAPAPAPAPVKRKAVRAPARDRIVYVVPRWSGCTCAM